MPTKCLIDFVDNSEKVFYAGQTVSGRVELTFTESKTVRGIYVDISGNAYCHWIEGMGERRRPFTGNETYLAERTYFAGGRDGKIAIQPGQYRYNFHCNLPVGLPSSLEGNIGYIRYEVMVIVDIALWTEKEFNEIFTVIKPLNLNYDHALRLPAMKEKLKVFYPCCCFCMCRSDPLHLVARIPVSGYTPGQTINVEIEVDNKSDIDANFSVQLMKVITYFIYPNSGKQRKETIEVGEKLSAGLSRPDSVDLFRAALVIPPISPTDVTTSNICKARYVLRVIGSVSGCHDDQLVNIPITIGSVPIVDNLNFTSHPLETSGTTSRKADYNFPVSLPILPTAPITQQPLSCVPLAPSKTLEPHTRTAPLPSGLASQVFKYSLPLASKKQLRPSALLFQHRKDACRDVPRIQTPKANEVARKTSNSNYPAYRHASLY